MKAIWKALCAAALVGMSILPAHAEAKTIKMGTMSWEDLTPITLITEKVLQDAGYKVKITEFSEWGIAFAALSKGDIQVLASQTNYVTQDYWNNYKNNLEKLSPVSHGLYQAIAVPSYVPLTSITQLNANAAKFHGKIIGIEPGSGLMRDTSRAMKAYGLKLRLIDGSTPAMTAELKAAVARKEWIAVTLWQPSWMMLKFDMKFLADPKGVYPPPQTYYWIAQKGFAASHPRARELMAGVFVPLSDITAINAAVADGKTMQQAVTAWTTSHADLIRRWENIKKY